MHIYKRLLSAVLLLALTVSLLACADTPTEPDPEKEEYGLYLYVSADGDDTNDGSEESPLSSLTGARDRVRAIRQESGLPDGGICVLFADGEYPMTATAEFTDEDSGEDGKPVVYRAEHEGKARLNAGFSLNAADFQPIPDDIRDLIVSEEARDHVLVLDLDKAGCPDLELREYCYFAVSDSVRRWNTTEQTLYVDGLLQTVARWPNEGFYRIPEEDCRNVERGDPDYYTLTDPSGHSAAWSKEPGQIMYYGYPLEDYVGYYLRVMSADPETGAVRIEVPNYRGLTASSPIYYFNLLSEIDIPGEYYIDYQSKKLYYYPVEDFASKPIVFTQMTEDIVSGNVSHIVFDGFVMEGTRNSAFQLNGDDQTFTNLEVRNVGISAMELNGNRITISGCHIHDIGGLGIRISDDSWQGNSDPESPTNTLEPSRVLITNNEIAFWGQKYGISSPAIETYRYGTVVSHNKIHDNRHNAIMWNAQNVTVEYNEIYNVCTEVSDCGAIGTGRNRDARGSMIRYNYFHDIVSVLDHYYPNAVYLDDTTEQHTVFGNIFVDIDGRAIAISADRFVTIQNNIIVRSNSISWDNRGLVWGEGYWDYPNGGMWVNLRAHPIYSDLWRYAFPMNLVYSEGSPRDAKYPDYFGTPAYANVSRNVAAELQNVEYIKIAEQDHDPSMWDGTGYLCDGLIEIHPDAVRYGTFDDNVCYDQRTDIGFADIAGGDLNLREDSPVFRDIIGFEKIPFDEIGLLPKDAG